MDNVVLRAGYPVDGILLYFLQTTLYFIEFHGITPSSSMVLSIFCKGYSIIFPKSILEIGLAGKWR